MDRGGVVLRLADLLAGLSRLSDLGFGLQSGEALRASALAALLGDSLDLPDEDVRAGLYTALLLHAGCVGYAPETARLYGDELVMSAASARTDIADPRDRLTTFVPAVTRGRPLVDRVRLVGAMFVRGARHSEAFATVACEVGQHAARRLGLSDEVQRSVYHSYEWWNGKGVPDGLGGDDIPLGARLAVLTTVASTFDVTGGVEAAVGAVRQQSDGILDPQLAGDLASRARELLGELNASDPRELVLASEPRPVVSVLEPDLVHVAAVFGDIADLKSSYTHGHSRGVAALAVGAGERLGLTAGDVADLSVVGSLHDIGRVAVSSAIWDKPGELSGHEWEQVRLHAYHGERILAGSERLARLARLAGAHHERMDGSGYHRGSLRTDLPMPARVLAAADSYQAMTEPRAFRPALDPDQAQERLLADARRGVLDAEAVTAVLAAAGREPAPVRREPPAGLTNREVEVLGLIASGSTNSDIARRLDISRRTAEQHAQNIYAKIGSSSRAAAAMFAMEHDLLPDGGR